MTPRPTAPPQPAPGPTDKKPSLPDNPYRRFFTAPRRLEDLVKKPPEKARKKTP